MPSKGQKVAGWVLTGLVVLLLLASSTGKFSAEAVAKSAPMGVSAGLLKLIGVLELVSALVYLVPKTSFLGVILVTGYLGGAIFAHLRFEIPTPLVPLAVAVVAWVGYGLRHPYVIKAAFKTPSAPAA